MKPKLLFYSVVLSVCGTALHPAGQSLLAADNAAAPTAPSFSSISQAAAGPYGQLPIDLARGSVGTRLQVVSGQKKNGLAFGEDQDSRSAQALISDDASLAYPLTPGVTSFVLTLPKIEVLSRFNFISYEAAGQVSVSVSSAKLPADSPEWRPVTRSHKFGEQEVTACPLGSVEARYVKIDFKTQNPGRIASFGLFGLPTINNFKVQPLNFDYISGAPAPAGAASTQNNNVYFDYANLYTGASVVAVSSGGRLDQAQAMLDGNTETSYSFDPADPMPTAVIDLGVRRSLNRLSCVYQAPAGRMDVYLVDNPGNAAGFQHVSLNYISAPQAGDAVSAPGAEQGSQWKHKAIISVDTTGQPGFGRASADLGGQSGRFLIAVFHPVATEPSHADFKDFKDSPRDFKDYKDRTASDFKDSPRDFKDVAQPERTQAPVAGAPARSPFRVVAFSAFGDVPNGNSVLRQTPPITNPPGGGGTTVPNQPPFPPTPQGGGIITP